MQASSLPSSRRKGRLEACTTPLLVLILAAALFVYFRPLTVYFAVRKAYLFAIGVRGHHVLVHGVAMRAEDWAPILRTFTKSHRVYAPDLLKELPQAKLVALEGCGHLAIIECRRAAREAAAFLDCGGTATALGERQRCCRSPELR